MVVHINRIGEMFARKKIEFIYQSITISDENQSILAELYLRPPPRSTVNAVYTYIYTDVNFYGHCLSRMEIVSYK